MRGQMRRVVDGNTDERRAEREGQAMQGAEEDDAAGGGDDHPGEERQGGDRNHSERAERDPDQPQDPDRRECRDARHVVSRVAKLGVDGEDVYSRSSKEYQEAPPRAAFTEAKAASMAATSGALLAESKGEARLARKTSAWPPSALTNCPFRTCTPAGRAAWKRSRRCVNAR